LNRSKFDRPAILVYFMQIFTPTVWPKSNQERKGNIVSGKFDQLALFYLFFQFFSVYLVPLTVQTTPTFIFFPLTFWSSPSQALISRQLQLPTHTRKKFLWFKGLRSVSLCWIRICIYAFISVFITHFPLGHFNDILIAL